MAHLKHPTRIGRLAGRETRRGASRVSHGNALPPASANELPGRAAAGESRRKHDQENQHLRYDPARWRAVARRQHEHRGKAHHRAAAHSHERRCHRGGLPHLEPRRLQECRRDWPYRGRQVHRMRPHACRRQRHRGRGRGAQDRQAPAHPHRPGRLAEPSARQAASHGGRGD